MIFFVMTENQLISIVYLGTFLRWEFSKQNGEERGNENTFHLLFFIFSHFNLTTNNFMHKIH